MQKKVAMPPVVLRQLELMRFYREIHGSFTTFAPYLIGLPVCVFTLARGGWVFSLVLLVAMLGILAFQLYWASVWTDEGDSRIGWYEARLSSALAPVDRAQSKLAEVPGPWLISGLLTQRRFFTLRRDGDGVELSVVNRRGRVRQVDLVDQKAAFDWLRRRKALTIESDAVDRRLLTDWFS